MDQGLVERVDELGVLHGCAAELAAGGNGRVVLVFGDAGIGKTALLRQFCDEAPRRFTVLWGTCDPLFTPRPLGPLLEPAADLGGHPKALVSGEAKPFDVAIAFAEELAAIAPAALIVEDIHWADEATLDVVRLLVRRAAASGFLLVLSYRSDQLDRNHPVRLVLGELPSEGTVTRLGLRGLSRDAVGELAAGSKLDVDELFERTAGNPFFVTETLAAGTALVPDTVRDAVHARVARLSPEARGLLDAVAIVPQRAEVWLLEALTEGALGALDECLRSGVLRAEADGVVFRHELARMAVEESLPPDCAVALHRRALAALADPLLGAADLARLAHHAEAAGDGPSVLRYAPAAGEQAASLGAPREAVGQYGRSLRFAGGLALEVRADLLERFADAAYVTDMRDQAVAALDEALAIHRTRGDALKQGDVLRQRSRLLVCIGRTTESKSDAIESIAILEQAEPGRALARAYSALSHVSMLADDLGGTIAWGNRAIELAASVGDVEAQVNALNNVGTVELARGDRAGEEKLQRSLALAAEAGLGPEVGRAYINLAAALTQQRRWVDADAVIGPGIAYCRERGLEAWLKCLLAARADSELAQGRWDEAAETAAGLLDMPRDPVVAPIFDANRVLALVRARRGDPGYWPLLDEVHEVAVSVGDLQFIAAAAESRAEVAWLEGRPDAIARETEQAFALALELGQPSFIGSLACWRWRAGLLTEPPAGADELHRLQISGEWERAAALWRDCNDQYHAALALVDSRDPSALRRALDELRALGANPAAAIAARRLRELGERNVPRGPRPQTRENPAGLTARELEVLPLLAEGLRNAEIAQRLVVSQKTVDHHVSSILRKLGVSSRGQAGAAAGRLGVTAAASPSTPAPR